MNKNKRILGKNYWVESNDTTKDLHILWEEQHQNTQEDNPGIDYSKMMFENSLLEYWLKKETNKMLK